MLDVNSKTWTIRYLVDLLILVGTVTKSISASGTIIGCTYLCNRNPRYPSACHGLFEPGCWDSNGLLPSSCSKQACCSPFSAKHFPASNILHHFVDSLSGIVQQRDCSVCFAIIYHLADCFYIVILHLLHYLNSILFNLISSSKIVRSFESLGILCCPPNFPLFFSQS